MAQSQQRKNTYQQGDSLSYLHKTSIVTDTGDPNHLLLEGRGPRMENDIHENYVYDELKVQCIEDHSINARNKQNS